MNRTDLTEAASWLVALDLDGTTLRMDGSISGAVIKQVRLIMAAFVGVAGALIIPLGTGTFLGMDHYAGSLLRQGFTEQDLATGGSDRLIDSVVAWVTSRPSAHASTPTTKPEPTTSASTS